MQNRLLCLTQKKKRPFKLPNYETEHGGAVSPPRCVDMGIHTYESERTGQQATGSYNYDGEYESMFVDDYLVHKDKDFGRNFGTTSINYITYYTRGNRSIDSV